MTMRTNKSLANRLLAETIAEMPDYLAKQDGETNYVGESGVERHVMKLFYEKLCAFWPTKEYHSAEELKRDLVNVVGAKVVKEKEKCHELHHQGCMLAMKHRLWCLMDGSDNIEHKENFRVGYTDCIGVGWPMVCEGNHNVSVEAIRILDDMTDNMIRKIRNVMPRLKGK